MKTLGEQTGFFAASSRQPTQDSATRWYRLRKTTVNRTLMTRRKALSEKLSASQLVKKLLFINGLFGDAVSSSQSIVSNYRMINK